LVLNLEDTLPLGVETLGPQLVSFVCLGQLGVYAYPFALENNPALGQVAYTQLAADQPRVHGPAFVGECSASGDDGDSGHRMHKIADETVGDPVGEIVQFRILAASDEGQDGDRRHLRLEP